MPCYKSFSRYHRLLATHIAFSLCFCNQPPFYSNVKKVDRALPFSSIHHGELVIYLVCNYNIVIFCIPKTLYI